MNPREQDKGGGEGSDRLRDYRAKRSASSTDEPFGGTRTGHGHLFVVQKHRATSLHWDLRLEMGGVLVSWAIPKGPSPNQADKRLAIHVEDHPLEYADFEGVIPERSYGAGPSIIWDRGVWRAVDDPTEGMKRGKLLFDLMGYKLKGRWTLVRTAGGKDNHWLLIKERDVHEDPDGTTEAYPDDSILSGLTVDELAGGSDFGASIRAQCRAKGAIPHPPPASEIRVMQAEPRDAPFRDDAWVFEVKYDGYRALAECEQGATRLFSRNHALLTPTFPELAAALNRLPYSGVLLDGEVVVNDDNGLPSFERIQRRGRMKRQDEIARAAVSTPATYYAFDLLAFEGMDLRALPLLARKEILKQVLPSVGPVRFSDHIVKRGDELYHHALQLGLEGVVGKRADSVYVGGRSRFWIKVRTLVSSDFVVHGFTDPAGGNPSFGALLLAYFDGSRYVYSGRVGTGFSEALRRDLSRVLSSLPRCGPPRNAPVGAGKYWVIPEVVVEVRFKEVTTSGKLRHPSLLRLRPDKRAEECGPPDTGRQLLDLPQPVAVEPDQRTVHLTNLDKVFWPEDGYRKGDLIEYYREIARWILPYLADRPVVLTRFPDGIHGKSFFQKNAPQFAPDWVRRVRLYSERSERELDYFVASDTASLLYLANSASIPLHIWQSQVAHIAHPDFLVLDLDPNDAPFGEVVTIAQFIRDLCDEVGLPCFVKTSGSTGLHVLVALGRQINYGQARNMAHLLALIVVNELGDIATVARRPSQREGKVYVDYLQNGHGRLIVAPYSVRARAGAAVSAPLQWEEVNTGLAISDHTIKTMPERMKQMADPMLDVLTIKPDLPATLRRIQSRLSTAAHTTGNPGGLPI